MHGHRGRGERQAGILLDLTHLILGIAIVVLAVLSFINPDGNRLLFPPVFLLAALLNGLNSLFLIKTRGRDKKKLRRGIFQALVALALLFLGVLSGVSIWL